MHSLYTHLTVRHSTAKELLIIMSFHSRSECQLFGAGCAVQLMTDYFFQNLRIHRLSSQCCGVFCPFSCFVWRNHVWFVSMCWDIVCVCIGHTSHQFVNSPGCAQEDLKESAVPVLRDTGQSRLPGTEIFLHWMPTAGDSQSPQEAPSASHCSWWFLSMSPHYSRHQELGATYLSTQGHKQRHFHICVWIHLCISHLWISWSERPTSLEFSKQL